jgi:hypothetical protein
MAAGKSSVAGGEPTLHSPYAGDGAQLAYGLGPDGRLRHISEVQGGKACDCVCPACRAPLVAKLPKEKITRHFAHLAETSCSGGPETAVHYLAKEVLDANKRLKVPSVEASSGEFKEVAYVTREMAFDRAEIERRLDGVTPDIIVYHGDRELLVEIYVTHRCGQEKIDRLKAMNLPALELDLSHLGRNATREEVAQAVTTKAPRKWLYNAKIDAAQRRADDKAAKAKLQKDRKLDEEARVYCRRYRALLTKPFIDASKLAATIDVAKELGFSELVSFPVAQEYAFKIRPTDWQSLLFNHYVINPVSRWDPFFEFEAVGYLLRYGIVDEMFEKSPRWELAERIRKIHPDITTPFEAVRAYFDFLATKEMLEREGSGWSVSLRAHYAVDAARRAAMRRKQERVDAAHRSRDLTVRLEGLLAHADQAAKSTFDLPAWLHSKHGVFDRTPMETAQDGGEDWERFSSALRAIDRAFFLDDPPPDLLGLPLLPSIEAAVRQRAAERERARQASEARERESQVDRERSLLGRAEACLGDDAGAWMEGAFKVGAKSRRILCRISDANLTWFLEELDREVRQRDKEARKTAEAVRVRAAFMDKATSFLGKERADLLFRTFSPKLGARPVEVLVDAKGLERCLAILPDRRAGARR